MEYTQIIATISPNSGKREVLEDMIKKGLDVVRFNFAHGNHDEYSRFVSDIREIAGELGKKIPIIGDLAGPKIRAGEVENGQIMLEEGKEIFIIKEEVLGNKNRLTIKYDNLLEEIGEGERILLNDGRQELKVIGSEGNSLICSIVRGGEIKSNRGVNFPDSEITLPALTEKDLVDIDFVVMKDLEYIALSFVKNAEDIKELRNILLEKGSKAKVIAKIETAQAIRNIKSILDEADAVMIARGDLALEVGFEKVPVLQREIIEKANECGKTVIVATQMMQSMVSSPIPTRAEVSDVANAVLDGADVIMLSDETAIGENPELSVFDMQKIIDEVEKERERKKSIKL